MRVRRSSPSAAASATCTGSKPADATVYTYDANGNRASRAIPSGPTVSYVSDQANRLTGVSSPAAGSYPALAASYRYDGDGLRSSKTVDGATTDFTWAGGNLVQDGSTNVIYGPDGPIETINGATTRFLHHDQLGSVRMITNPSGSPVGTYTYDPYGKTTAHTGESVSLQYAGQYSDAETGFYYLRARYYDPATAQFLTRDPLVASTRSAYGYVGNNPLNGTDPSGLFCVGSMCTPSFDDVAEGLDDAWDATGGKAVSWVADNPGTAATIGAVVLCVGPSILLCGVATAGAFGTRSAERIADDGWSEARDAILVDGLVTTATFGLVAAPASSGLTRGGSVAVPGLLAAGERGFMYGAPLWQEAIARFIFATPDLGGLIAGWWYEQCE